MNPQSKQTCIAKHHAGLHWMCYVSALSNCHSCPPIFIFWLLHQPRLACFESWGSQARFLHSLPTTHHQRSLKVIVFLCFPSLHMLARGLQWCIGLSSGSRSTISTINLLGPRNGLPPAVLSCPQQSACWSKQKRCLQQRNTLQPFWTFLLVHSYHIYVKHIYSMYVYKMYLYIHIIYCIHLCHW